MKTAELTGAALDWAVAKCENEAVLICGASARSIWTNSLDPEELNYSTDWSQGGPIIDREEIGLGSSDGSVWPLNTWIAAHPEDGAYFFGPTPLIAAMRCFVASKLGDEVDVPKELTP